MASACPLGQAFALLIPLSKTAAATTTVRRNLPYIIGHDDIDVTPAIRHRIIRLSFNAIAGRRSFTFGASRASDYQLPHLDGIAKHHFALYFDSNDHALYLNNTSSERIHLSSAASIILLTTSNSPFRITTPSTTITVGSKACRFKLMLPTPTLAYEEAVKNHFLLLRESASLNPVNPVALNPVESNLPKKHELTLPSFTISSVYQECLLALLFIAAMILVYRSGAFK